MAVRGFQPLYTSRFSNLPLPLPSKDPFARNGTSGSQFFAPLTGEGEGETHVVSMHPCSEFLAGIVRFSKVVDIARRQRFIIVVSKIKFALSFSL